MARYCLFFNIFKEAYAIDLNESRRQRNFNIRDLTIFNTQKHIVENYRLSEELIDQVFGDIQCFLKNPKRRRRGLMSKLKLLCALLYLASGSYQRICGRNINSFVSQPSVSRSLREVVEALCHSDILKKYIRFPQNARERLELKKRFYEKYRIPGVIGCVDGTYVTMIRPRNNEERYYCRKGFHARNVQLFTDADCNIIHVDATDGEASHDSFIFNNCSIRDHLEELIRAGESVYLLGDSGYAQRPYLMVPVQNPQDGSPEHYYNQLHSTARNTVERTIGILKGRFRCLLVHRVFHYDPEMVAKIVIACCVLHNICNSAGLPALALQESDREQEASFHGTSHQAHVEDVCSEAAIGQSFRQDSINNLWRERNSSL